MLIQNHEKQKLIEKYWVGHGQKMGVATLKLAVYQTKMNFWCADTTL